MGDNRVTYRRRHSYNTLANRVRKVRTPGGRLVVQYVKKTPKAPHCGDCKVHRILGVPAATDVKRRNSAPNKRTVSRAYGGSRCGNCVRERIIRAFLIEEQKIVKRVLKAQQSTAAVAKK